MGSYFRMFTIWLKKQLIYTNLSNGDKKFVIKFFSYLFLTGQNLKCILSQSKLKNWIEFGW